MFCYLLTTNDAFVGVGLAGVEFHRSPDAEQIFFPKLALKAQA